ncbi:MAG: hypothetical protein K2M30_04780 [Desulfovibrionaceae bacterium]|nr:hypothetical protein [Desulfovibrionaceae bacterium]
MSISSLRYNLQSAITRRALNSNESALQQAVSRLSSGKKYVGTEDGPASYSILEVMQSILGTSKQGVINAQNGISLLDTADAALSNIERIFTDISVLAEDSSNGVWTDEQRTVFNNQAQQLLSIVDNISQSTNFLGTPLIDGTMEPLTLQLGITNSEFDILTIEMPSMRTSALTNGLTTPSGNAIDLSTQESALASVANVKTVLTNVRGERSNIGAVQNAVETTIRHRSAMNNETESTISTIGDADVALEMEAYTNATARIQASQYMFSVAMESTSRLAQLIQSI